MFENLRNIDSAFQFVRTFAFIAIIGNLGFSTYMGYITYQGIKESQDRIYILAEGKALEAFSSSKRENIPVEARDHVKMFHYHFFTLSPDDEQIRNQISKSFYLADGSAKKVYDQLMEQGYYSELISSNINQFVELDSVQIYVDSYPFKFKFFGKEKIIRPSSILTRTLLTAGTIRQVDRSDQNPHGLLIGEWEILENRDLKVERNRSF